MAHKVLSSDMAELIRTMRLAQQYSSTPLDVEYRKNMLKAAHVLAMDSKNLLDAVDNSRRCSMQKGLKMQGMTDEQSSLESSQVESADAGDNVFDGESTGETSLRRLTLNSDEKGLSHEGDHVSDHDTADISLSDPVELNQSIDLDLTGEEHPQKDGVLNKVEDDSKKLHSPPCNNDIENVVQGQPLGVRW